MNGKLTFGFVVEYVQDMERAKRFYRDVLGLAVEREHPEFVQFATFALAADQAMDGKKETRQEVFWLVDDIAAAYARLLEGADVCLPIKQFPFGKVFGLTDPEGLPRYILELAGARPSRVAV